MRFFTMSPYLIPEQLKRNSTTPLYTQIYEQLKRELVLGKYKAGERFYSYRKLKGIYKTELRTIGAALDLLIADGLVEKRATSGIYVTGLKKVSEVGNLWYAVIAEQHYHPFFYNILIGLVNEAEKFGLRVVVRMGCSREEFLQWFVPHPGEGLVITGDVDDDLLTQAGAKCKGNMIVVGNYDLQGDYGQVVTNSLPPTRKALEKAIRYGCKRLALVTPSRNFQISRDLQEVLEACAAEHDVATYVAEDIAEDGYRAMSALSGFRPDCVLLTEPAFAGAWEYMVEHSLRCPEDLFLIRYGKELNDNSLARRAAIDLGGNSVKHGAAALHMLLNNSKEKEKIDLDLYCNLKEK